ncbi:hypothetical protein ACFSQ7_22595 [Paenibacillus rhizoplanae]
MNRGLQSLGILKNPWMLAVLAGVVILLSACGTATDPIPEKKAEESTATVEPEADAILVEVLIESDSDAALNLEVEVNARDHPQSVYFDSIQLPYREEFAVPQRHVHTVNLYQGTSRKGCRCHLDKLHNPV